MLARFHPSHCPNHQIGGIKVFQPLNLSEFQHIWAFILKLLPDLVNQGIDMIWLGPLGHRYIYPGVGILLGVINNRANFAVADNLQLSIWMPVSISTDRTLIINRPIEIAR